ncbi:MAG: gliding motility-associated protein GldE [Paludibacteraceae bacterium]|nr:gliding motility-associated protein GldE [Paludibacteraceae bacterium]
MDTNPLPALEIDNIHNLLATASGQSLLWTAAIGTIVFLYQLFLCSYYEYSLYSLSKNELGRIASSNSEEYLSLKRLLKHPAGTLSAIVAGYYTAVAGSICCITLLTKQLVTITGVGGSLPQWLLLLAELLGSMLVTMLVGDFIPALLKTKKRQHTLYLFSGQMLFLSLLYRPLGHILRKTTNIVDRRLEVKTQHRISLGELQETLNTENVKQNVEKAILEGIVNFGNICVDEIMRPRVDIVDLDIAYNYKKVLEIVKESEYSRLPVYEDSIDNIKGILYVKDLLNYINEDENFEWQSLIRKPYFVPETKKIDELLKEFQSKHIHMAIVVDEFGGTSGIATLENILEVIVGDISDEHDDEQKMFTALDKHNYIMEGKLPLNDFYKIDKIDRTVFEKYDADADTLAGLLLEIKGDIPAVGEKIEADGYLFQIISADNRRIKKVKLHIPD